MNLINHQNTIADIKSLRYYPQFGDNGRLYIDYDSYQTQGFHVSVYRNNQYVGRVAPSTDSFLNLTNTGTISTIEALPFVDNGIDNPVFASMLIGNRISIKWNQSTDIDTAKHEIQYKLSSGSTYTTLGTINTYQINAQTIPTVAGGRIQFNETVVPMAMEILLQFGSGTFDYLITCSDGTTLTGTQDFEKGTNANLPYNVVVSFLDEITAYQAQDEMTVYGNLKNSYLSASLATGTYNVKVLTVDNSGNGSSSAVATVDLVTPRTGVSNVHCVHDGSNLIITYTDPTDVTVVGHKVFVNYDINSQEVLDYINYAHAVASPLRGAQTATIAVPLQTNPFNLWVQIWSYYNGYVVKDITTYNVNVPYVLNMLPPQNFKLERIDAVLYATWDYYYDSQTDNIEFFRVNTGRSVEDCEGYDTVSPIDGAYHYTYELSDIYGTGTLYVMISSSDVLVSEWLSATFDTVAPTAVTITEVLSI